MKCHSFKINLNDSKISVLTVSIAKVFIGDIRKFANSTRIGPSKVHLQFECDLIYSYIKKSLIFYIKKLQNGNV